MAHALLVANPHARKLSADPDLLWQILGCLRRSGLDVELHLAAGPNDAAVVAAQAAASGYDRVIVAGGDGTANQVANGIAGTETALALVPLGTGNALGHYLGLRPGDIEGACRLAAMGHVRRIDLGRANGRHFVSMGGVGLDAQVASAVMGHGKSSWGPWAFVGQFLRTVARLQPWDFRVELDGEPVSGRWWGLFLCNTPQYTWRVRLAASASTGDGLLNVLALAARGHWRLLTTAATIFLLEKPGESQPDMVHWRVRNLVVDTNPPAPWQVDGEVGGMTPLRCEIIPRALKVVADRGQG